MTDTNVRIRLSLDPKEKYPEKLYDVVNDGRLVHWNRNGSVSVTDEREFEENVMKMYPGFLQISSFVNFRRLFREYGFDWQINQNGDLEFSHPSFVRGRRVLLSEIKTRRKAFQAPRRQPSGESLIIETEPNKRYSTRKRRRTSTLSPSNVGKTREQSDVATYISNSSPDKKCQKQIKVEPRNERRSCYMQAPAEPRRVMDAGDVYARNEFTEDEYREWLGRRRKFDKTRVELEIQNVIEEQFEWMYYSDSGIKPEPVYETSVNSVPKEQPHFNTDQELPCGFCCCCIAMNESGLYYDIYDSRPSQQGT